MVRLVFSPEAGEHLDRAVGAELRVRKEIVRSKTARHAPPAETSLCFVRDVTRIGGLKRTRAKPARQTVALTLRQRVVDEQLARTTAAQSGVTVEMNDVLAPCQQTWGCSLSSPCAWDGPLPPKKSPRG